MSEERGADPAARFQRARLSLEGLSIGDAFGEKFFRGDGPRWLFERQLPPSPWAWTDDTAMAVSILEILRQHGEVNQDALAQAFAHRWREEPFRGYGAGAFHLLEAVHQGKAWRPEANGLFGGSGSWGNGGAMRVAPLGAWFADSVEADPDGACFNHIAEQARLSAEITHAHPDGQDGAVAVAVAAGWIWREAGRPEAERQPLSELFAEVRTHLSEGEVARVIRGAGLLFERGDHLDDLEKASATAVEVLGNGSQISALDTVPVCLWLAATGLDPKMDEGFEATLWRAARLGGDIDTNCAIVGGMMALSARAQADGLPSDWISAREGLPL